MMTTVMKRRRSRRRLAALTFLSNISLDGSHRDTKLGLFTRAGSSEEKTPVKITTTGYERPPKSSAMTGGSSTGANASAGGTGTGNHPYGGCTKSKCQESKLLDNKENKGVSKSNMELMVGRPSEMGSLGAGGGRLQGRGGGPGECNAARYSRHASISEDRATYILPTLQNVAASVAAQSPKEPRDRVHSFVSETRARLSSLSQRRKHQLLHQRSMQEQILSPSCESIDSIVCGGRSRNASSSLSESSLEVRFISNKEQTIKDERLVLVSSKKAPFVVFSSLPYHRRSFQMTTARGDPKTELNWRGRHPSGSRQLSIITDSADPLDLLGLVGFQKPEEGLDISYSQLLWPSSHHLHYQGSSQSWRCYRVPESAGSGEHPHLPPVALGRCLSCTKEAIPPSLAARGTSSGGGTTGHPLSGHGQPPQQPSQQQVPGTPPPNLTETAFDWDDCHDSHPSSCHHCFGLGYLSYHPNLLGDPELVAGKHSTVLTFPGYVTSIIDYVKPSDLKKELNGKFRERFPHIQLTLSKLRSLKREMCKIARQECGIDLLTVAQAYVYFEKLILKVLVNKPNRKLCAGACLLLSAKLNDVKGADLKLLIEKIETVFRLSRKDLLASEFGVLVALEFSLHLSTWEIFPHYQRLLYES